MAHPTDDRNFRLPLTVRPRRYEATLTLDLPKKRFAGQQRVELLLEQSTDELVLHALKLDVRRVRFHPSGGGAPVEATGVRVAEASETVVLTFPGALPAGEGALEVEWEGGFTEGLRGLYLSGQPGQEVAATQFEAADCRRVFPSFDEPLFKARWALTVRVPEGLEALGNGRVVSDEKGADGLRTVRFEETELLSSYLVALVVGRLVGTAVEEAAGIPVRTWALPHKKHLLRFGQDAALAALPRLQDYFGLPYAFGKVDQVGIPDFEAGAMENAGLITYREVALLLDPATAPLMVQKRVAEVVTHELAHQWFGNWVTMVWWDDLWLNEAFATWMAYKVVDAWKPQWRVWLDFDQGKAVALHLDALRSTHPIRGEVRNAGEAGESFDAITYEKGGAVLRMIEGFLGEEAFRDGIRRYMRKHARANAVADDLWAALGEASRQPVLELANAWLRQSGYPLVSLEVQGRRVRLGQRRFYSEPGVQSGETWPVPVVLRYGTADGQVKEQRALLRAAEDVVELPVEPAWVCGNGGNTGFYRVAYDGAALERLTGALPLLQPSERVSLLADSWAQVRAGLMDAGAFLTLAERYREETDDAVLDELVGRLAYVEARLVDGEALEAFRAFVARLLGHQLAQAGWDAGGAEADGPRLRRAALVRALGGVARQPPVLAEARARVLRMLAGDGAALEPNLLDPALGASARGGDAALFDALRERFPKEPDPATQRRYLMGLAAFEEPALAARAQGLLLDGTVPMQDSAGFVTGLLNNRTAREGFWETFQKRWPEVRARTGGAPMLLRRVVEAVGGLRERRHLEQAQAFFQANPVPEASQAVAQTLERLSQDVALRERAAPAVAAWLKARAGA
jgi:puromycin-sensitive aminopeptidase